MIEEHQVQAQRLDGLTQFFDLASPQVQARIRAWPVAGRPRQHRMSGRDRQGREFVEGGVVATVSADRNADQQGS